MPITVNELERNEVTIPFEVGGQTGELTYTPWNMAPSIEGDMKALKKSHGDQTVLARMLSEVLVSWDVQPTAESEPYAVDFETLLTVPTVILGAAMGAIFKHMRPAEDEKKISGGGSSNRQMTTARQSGTGALKRRNI